MRIRSYTELTIAASAVLCAIAIVIWTIVSTHSSAALAAGYDRAVNPGAMPRERYDVERGPYKKPALPPDLSKQTQAEADAKSTGCLSAGCHVGIEEMHPGSPLGCVDCHGGSAIATKKELAHVHPLDPRDWPASGQMPMRSYAMLNDESPAFVRFVNPGDLRAARMNCGNESCHADEVEHVRKSMMSTGVMLWEAALYANAEYPSKLARFGEGYTEDGRPTRIRTLPEPTIEDTLKHGILPFLDPLPRFEISQPGNVLRVFERGNDRLSVRGYGTETRTDPVFLSLHKTRLLTRVYGSSEPTIMLVTIGVADVADATSSMRMIAIPGIRRSMHATEMRAVASRRISLYLRTFPASRYVTN